MTTTTTCFLFHFMVHFLLPLFLLTLFPSPFLPTLLLPVLPLSLSQSHPQWPLLPLLLLPLVFKSQWLRSGPYLTRLVSTNQTKGWENLIGKRSLAMYIMDERCSPTFTELCRTLTVCVHVHCFRATHVLYVCIYVDGPFISQASHCFTKCVHMHRNSIVCVCSSYNYMETQGSCNRYNCEQSKLLAFKHTAAEMIHLTSTRHMYYVHTIMLKPFCATGSWVCRQTAYYCVAQDIRCQPSSESEREWEPHWDSVLPGIGRDWWKSPQKIY